MKSKEKQCSQTGLIFGARSVPAELAKEALCLCEGKPLVIAADAGWREAVKNGFEPNVVLGDFDSAPCPQWFELGADENGAGNTEWIVLPKAKDDTDLHYAAKEAVRRGLKRVVLLGVLGGRIDHSLASLSTLFFLRKSGLQAEILDEAGLAYCVLPGEETVVHRRESCYLSVFPLAENAEGVKMEGLVYPAENACFTKAFPVGVSNEFRAERARISCKTGGLFVLVVKKDAPML